jgi:hypothetical protein
MIMESGLSARSLQKSFHFPADGGIEI